MSALEEEPTDFPVVASSRAGYPAFQDNALAQLGSFADTVADVAAAGGGRIRRIQQCELYWAALFPADETAADLFNYGSIVPPPSRMLTGMTAASTDGMTGYERFSSTAAMIIACLLHGVRADLTVFNGGGGMPQNYSQHSTSDYVRISGFHDSTVPFTGAVSIEADAPSWMAGYLIPAGGDDTRVYGWHPFYWRTGAPPTIYGHSTEAVTLFQQFVVNVWPTWFEASAPRSGYDQRCATRKCLGLAAFATGVGSWLAKVEAALGRIGANLTDVVEVIQIGNELDQFFYLPGGTAPAADVEAGILEAGAYLALLAGPIHAAVPTVKLRVELESWPAPDILGEDSFAARVLWLKRVLEHGIPREVVRWTAIELAREGKATGAGTSAWLLEEEIAGFIWPPLGTVARCPARELIHQIGVHWYHSYNLDSGDSPQLTGYADAIRAQADVLQLRALVSHLAAAPGYALDLCVAEIGFPAVDPGYSATLPWGPRYGGTSEELQAAMYVRLCLVLLAAGVDNASLYTLRYGPAVTDFEYGASNYPYTGIAAGWTDFSSMGVRNDVVYRGGYAGESRESGTDDSLQAQDCWPRSAWFAFRRLVWLLSQGTGDPGVDLRICRNHLGLTVIELTLTGLSQGPDGASLLASWPRAYIIWLDQYASEAGVHTEVRVDSPDTAEIQFGYDTADPLSGTGYETLALVPTVVPPASTDCSDDECAYGVHQDSNGYAASATAPTWSWAGDSALSGTPTISHYSIPRTSEDGLRSFSDVLSIVVNKVAPDASSPPGTAIAPLCILTNAYFDRTGAEIPR